jgi:hypothetical protein
MLRWTLWLAIAALVALAAPVRADEDATPSGGAPFDSATPKQSLQARTLYQEGVRLHTAGKLSEALAKLRASYGVVKSPNSRLMIVKALGDLGRWVEAYREAVELVAEAEAAAAKDAKKYGKTVTEAKAEESRARAEIALVTVRVKGTGAKVKLDDEPLPEEEWGKPRPVAPGEIVAELEGAPPQKIEVEGGGEATIELAVPTKKKKRAPAPTEGPDAPGDDWGWGPDRLTWAIIAGSAGGGALILFGIFGGLTLSAYDEVEQGCAPDPQHCEGDFRNAAERGQAYQALANVSLVAGILGVAAGGGLLLWEFLDEGEGDTGDASITPRIGPGSVGVGGTF